MSFRALCCIAAIATDDSFNRCKQFLPCDAIDIIHVLRMPQGGERVTEPIKKILIVGAGIGGLTAAIQMKRAGFNVDVVEINKEWMASGVGILLSGATLRALGTVGVLDEVVAAGFGIDVWHFCDYAGNKIGAAPQPRIAGPNYPGTIGVPRRSFFEILTKRAKALGVIAKVGVTVAELKQDHSGVDVIFTDGSHKRYDLVVGADGVHSKIRAMVFGPGLKPHYTGQSVWRFTTQRPAETDAGYLFYGPQNKVGFAPMTQELMYLLLVHNLPTVPRMPEDRLHEILREQIVGYEGIVVEVANRLTDPKSVVFRPLEALFIDGPWYRGRVVLVGDAAHAVTPHLASGGGLAIEDAVVLTEVLQQPGSLTEQLESFMKRRYARCKMVFDNGLQLGEWEKNPTPDADPAGLSARSYQALAQPI